MTSSDANDNTSTIMADDVWPASTTPNATTIGSYSFGVTGFFGFGERKPKSKSTSDVLGAGWNDLLVRDAAGQL